MSGTKVTVSGVNQKSGSAVITIKVSAGTNHNAPADKTCTVKVNIFNTTLNSNTWAAIKAASDKLTEVSYDVFGKIYQQAQQQNPGAGAGFNGSDAGSANTGSAPHDDNVVDADYEVVDDQK